METIYSYKEEKEVIMLNEDEWKYVEPEKFHSIRQVKNFRDETGLSLKETLEIFETDIQKKYYELTGIKEKNYNLIYQRRRSDYGPICSNCNKPFRTPRASFCAECGNEKSLTNGSN